MEEQPRFLFLFPHLIKLTRLQVAVHIISPERLLRPGVTHNLLELQDIVELDLATK